MTDEQKKELVRRVEEEFGVSELFKILELHSVSKKGDNVYCVCPFHNGADNPNGFAYSNHFGYCFTQCNKRYDLFDIVMRAKGLEFLEAVGYLAELVGMDIDHSVRPIATSDGAVNRGFLAQLRKAKQSKKVKEWTPIDVKILADFEPLMHTILRKEGYDEEVREFFGIGFSRTGYLRDRITIPVDSVDGSIVTVSGRSVLPKEHCEDLGMRRYQIWFDTDKSVTLYNLSRALPYIEITKRVLVFEGFKSVWRLHQWGFDDSVCTMGSSLSDEQRKILLKLGVTIIVCGDRDKAGKEFNEKVKQACHRYSDVEVMDMYLLDVPETSSPDDITREQFLYLYNNRK